MPLIVDVGLGWVTAVLLCSLRLAAMLLMTPILDGFGMPARVRVLVVVALSASLVSSIPHEPVVAHDIGALIVASAGEVAIGALMGFGAMSAFAVFSFAGNLLDQQIGFGLANVFDPMTHAQSPLIASIFGLLAVLVFFVSEAHHVLLRGFAYSLDKLPLGAGLNNFAIGPLARQFGLIFSFGLLLAAPVMFCLYMIEIGLAVISRNLPQMNIFMVSAPVKIICGLVLLSLLMPHLAPLFGRVFGAIFDFWQAVL